MKALRKSRLTPEFIYEAICDCFKGKLKRDDVCGLILDMAHEKYPNAKNNVSLKEIKNFIAVNGINSASDILWYMADKYYEEIKSRSVTFVPIKTSTRVEESSGKERKLCLQSIKQLIFDYITVGLMKPVFDQHFGPYQSASIEGRGQTHAINAIKKWVAEDYDKKIFYVKTDIKHYFNSVNLDDLRRMLHEYVYDPDTLYLLNTILATYPEGLSIGSYLSQYLANLYMSDVYHYIAGSLTRTRRNKTWNTISHVLIYMDDILVFAHTITDANHAIKRLEKCMKYKGLELHNTIVDEFREGEYIDIIGYRVYRNCVTMRKRNYDRMSRLAKIIKKRKLTLVKARAVTSYFGLCIHSNHCTFARRFKFDKVVNNSRDLISDVFSTKKKKPKVVWVESTSPFDLYALQKK